MPMYDPAHPGAILRDSVEDTGWTVTECARKLGVSRNTLSRLLNERIGISPAMALGLERIGWSNADFWMLRSGRLRLGAGAAAARSGSKENQVRAPESRVANRCFAAFSDGNGKMLGGRMVA